MKQLDLFNFDSAQAMIRKEGNKYVLYTRDGKRKLGTHDTRKDAERQERLIEMKKHGEKPETD